MMATAESDDDAIWVPPDEAAAAADSMMQDDDDDDDDYHAGTGEEDDESEDDDDATSSICRWRHDSDHQSAAHREERQKAMLRAMNGQLRMLAARFLESAGIDTSSWLDIVISLSWEAALAIKPDVGTAVGNQMDPSSYIKVKCLASGTPRQCEVVKGLVFRKNVAHKHMPTKCHNPRLLLLSGLLGHSHVGFSSFSSIEQEKDHLDKSVCEMMEICRPDVVLVERTVSRDIQELLLKEGVTLVLDMKLNRLQRVARCSGAPIVSFSEVLSKPKLKQCDYFHIEKVTEEHSLITCSAGVGSRPSKTLMFLEGFHKPLGCTILLRGANTQELKKIKQVMNYTVFAAYRLVLETSFFEDQRLILNNKDSSKEEVSVARKAGPSSLGSVQETTDSNALNPLDKGFPNQALLPSEGLVVSAVPESPRRFIDILRYHNIYLPVTSSQEATDHQIQDSIHISPNVGVPIGSVESVDHLSDPQEQASSETNQQMALDGPSVSEKHEQSLENIKTSDTDEVDDVLESQSILILLSSQCITKQVICEQSRLSRIRYYGNFDVSLGRYLQDILQKQNLSCSSCGEPPEAHMYSYTHRNGNLTVLVRHLLPKYRLPGESEGKIWMWTRCLRCERESGISRSSRRVIMSAEAHYLSFGKFLELSFSNHSTARRLSICGHSLNTDCLRFFGLGSKVAMFQYSSVEIYNACKPQPTLEFHNPDMHEWYGQEVRNVLATGVTLFSEVTSALQKLKDQFPVKDLSQLEEMLIKEKAEFMDSLAKTVDRNRESSSVDDILNVNWLYQDLLLELYVWDCRLHQLVDCTLAENAIVANGQTAAAAEADGIGERMSSIAPFENRCIKEPEKFIEAGTASALLDDAWNDKHCNDQHNTNCECDGGEEKWIWNPVNESRLAFRQEVEVGCLERFEVVNHYCPSHLSPLHKHRESGEEMGGSPQFTVGPGGSILCVSEDEISSIISRALAVSEERRHLLMDAVAETEPADTTRSKTMDKSYSSLSESSSASLWSSDSEASISSDDLSSYDTSLLLSSSLHPEIAVNGITALKGRYSVICVHSNQFYNLRRKCCPSELAYVASLSRCKRWDAQGGKSKAFFARTMDGRLIIKQIKKTEFESFIKFAPDYFRHVNHSLDTGSQTCLAKILGIYQVKQTRHGKEIKMDLMVMENILFGHNVSRTYDLKGAIFSRYVSDPNDHAGTVYLDQNFVDDMRVSPIYIGGRAKHLLERAIWNDTSFLTSINVMDYSLLVGVDRQKRELVFGIIDYLRQYTWDKQLETMVKASLVVPKNESPTVISPRDYKKRFRKFMSKHFLTVPDEWSTESRPPVAWESCAHAGELPGVKPQHPSPILLACA
ncbi:putative 1-phosphatidylinositol-3-phosphate 5-kinase FAB1D isoform X3 [Zea mays]|nr:putative 1-phosphatidylinositol-3-phosphate 5-kinase FAB1D isoform X3 [Zea mays]ONM15732.1 Putative 1-phosphatidylinositol-3-phosphate 5-kinase FAB1D [Zea mays]|eukprot:XP_008669131.1 putative 1-phosphatidylinositol-3-phosphate 5-kinase FAB1D isoform X3 [Zea mays]